MAKSKPTTAHAKIDPQEDMVEIRVGAPILGPDAVQLQSGLGDKATGVITKSLDELKNEWDQMMARLKGLVSATAASATDSFAVDSVEFALGFSAKGKLVFVAEAGVDATVSVVFKPRTGTSVKTP